ncbi:MAG: hypothetical protein HY238_14025 [Acidobacteria bacterium]|nr:hypothetical protein [Acidobacteriota bacterium]
MTVTALLIGSVAACIGAVPALRPLRVAAATLSLSVLLALTTSGLRNRLVTGEFALGSSHDGITLWEFNGPYTKQTLCLRQVEALPYDFGIMGQHSEAGRVI